MTTSIWHHVLPRLQDWSSEELQDRVANTRFAFRVFDDLSRVTYDQEQGFIPYGQSIDERTLCLYQSAAHHVDRSFRIRSPWISASRRWDWALWEMTRRSRQYAANCHIRVAIIDVYALLGKVNGPAGLNPHLYHALLLLDPFMLQELCWKSTWSDRLPTQLQNFANIADEILFLKCIPASAIVSVVALDDIIRDVPGYSTGWLEGTSFRDAHEAMCNNHLSCSNWNPDVKALEYVDFALALLRPTYNNLRTVTWSLFLDVVRDSSPSLMAENPLGDLGKLEGWHEKANGERPDPVASLVGGMSTLSVETSPQNVEYDNLKQPRAITDDFKIQTKILSDQATRILSVLKAEVSKQSMISDLTQLLAEEASTAETCPAEQLERQSPAGSSNCRPLILVLAAQLLDQCHVVVSPEIARHLDSARQKIQCFKQRSRSLATSLLFSHIAMMRAADWARLQRQIKKGADTKVAWLEETLGLLGRSEKTEEGLVFQAN